MREPDKAKRIGYITSVAVALLSGLVTAGCGTQHPLQNSPAQPAGGITATALDDPLDHIHGSVVDYADGTVLVATHSGIRRIDSDGAVTRVGRATDDFMALTVPRSDRWLASGHPNSTQSGPDPLGLIESVDQGRSWSNVSRSGRTDFHALSASGNIVVGSDGAKLIRSQDAGTTWDAAAGIRVSTLAYSGRRLLAVTQAGLAVSTDNGDTFHFQPNSPNVVHLSANGRNVWSVDRNNNVWLSSDSGATWKQKGNLRVQAAGIAAVDAAMAYAITTTEVITIR